MLKNIAASAIAAMCLLAVSTAAGAEGMIDGIADAGKDVVDGIADAGRDIADGITGDGATGDGATGDGIIGGGTADDSGMGSEDVDPEASVGINDSEDGEDSETSDTVLGETDRPNPDTGVSFGYIASAAVLGALGVAVTVNKRRS